MNDPVPAVVVVAASAVAVLMDVRSFRVRNWLTFPLLLSGLVYHGLSGAGDGLRASVSGALLGFCVLIIPFAMGATGAGDVKLLTALGAWLGPQWTASVALIGCLCTGLYSFVVLVRRRGWSEAWFNIVMCWYRLQTLSRHLGVDGAGDSVQQIAEQSDRRSRLIPFSLMLGIGVGLTLLWPLLPSG